MASRASVLLGSLLDRLLPAARRPHPAASSGGGSAWTQPWPPGPSPEPGDTLAAADPPDDGTPAPEPRGAGDTDPAEPGRAVGVTVVGAPPPGASLVEGTIDEDATTRADRRAAATPGAPPAEPGRSPAEPDPRPGPPGPPAAGTGRWRLRDVAPVAAGVAVLILLAGLGIQYRQPLGTWLTTESVRSATGEVARAWQADGLDGVSFDPASEVSPKDPGDDGERSSLVAAAVAAATAGLTGSDRDVPREVRLVGDTLLGTAGEDGARTARQQVRVQWLLDDGHPWAYRTTLELRQRGSRWRVVYHPTLVHPALTAESGLLSERVQAERAPLLAADGRPLVAIRMVHRVYFRSRSLITPYGDLRRIADLTGVNRDRLVERYRKAHRGDPIEIARLSDDAWRRIRSRALDVDGVTVTSLRLPVATTPSYAGSPVGDVLPATRALAAASSGALRVGDLIGMSGLQDTYDARLRGAPGLRVVVADLPTTGRAEPLSMRTGEPPSGRLLVDLAPPRPAEPVRLAEDGRAQES